MTMQSCDYEPQKREFTGRKFLAIVIAFFTVIIAVNMTMLYFAVNNFSGLVVTNSYVASQKFEADRARLDAAAISGWRIGAGARAGRLTLALSEAEGAPVRGARLTGVVGRRSHDRQDQQVSFTEIAPGRYEARIELSPGAWRLTFSAADAPEAVRRVDFKAAAGGESS